MLRPAPCVWRCEECRSDPECLEARGFCTEKGLKRSTGADHGEIEAALAVGAGATHLGTSNTCPIYQILRYRPQLEAALREYSLIKRLNLRSDLSISPDVLLAIDEEVSKIHELEVEDGSRKSGNNKGPGGRN